MMYMSLRVLSLSHSPEDLVRYGWTSSPYFNFGGVFLYLVLKGANSETCSELISRGLDPRR